ncbi:MAG TPA: winged helix-turn-helix domain-containing protein [Lysobacter sp.]|jgi:DNA-binding winged helix-turn-helix (wHTH) protein/tetratricopeptide (TPR) repeat protein|nr:winged helix-turn-helix domain-containing protein [Lysobacter sp.]
MRPKYLFGEFELNPASRELLRNGKPIALRPRSLECLIYLIEHRDRAVGRDELIAAVWGRVDASDTVVAQTLLRARKALDDTGNQQVMIRTLPRFGYRWVAPIKEVAIPSDANVAETVDAGGQFADAVPSASAQYVEPDSETESDVEGEALDGDGALEVEPPEAIGAGVEEATEVSPAIGKQRRLLRIGLPLLVALVVAVGLGSLFYSRHSGEGPMQVADDAVLVMPVTVIPTDSENAWVRLGGMDYMAARLRSSGINVLPSEQALRLSAAIEGDAPAVARKKLLSLSGARWIAMPEVRQERNGWRVRLHLFGAGAEQWVETRGSTALAAAAEAADAWLRQLGGQGETGPPPSPMIERLHRLDAEILAGRLQEARRLVRTWPPAERSDARFLYREGRLEFRGANLDAAAKLFQRALDQAQKTDVETKIGALLGLGGVERNRGNLGAAELRFTQALTLAESLPPDRVNSRLVGFAYQGRGIVHAQQGDLDASIRDMGQARVWAQRSGDLVALATNGHNLGKAEVLRGDYLQALREFDRAIEIFERFRVNDYLANTLHEKAELQMALARPGDAWESASRAAALAPKLEDDGLAVLVLATKARIQIAQGRMRDIDDTLAGIRSRGVQDTDPVLREVLLRLHLARGELAEARKLDGKGPSSTGAGDGLRLAAVQVALRIGDLPLAKSWLSGGTSVAEQDARYHAVALALARALIARTEGDGVTALQHAERAAGVTGVSPEAEIQTGVVQARVLLDARQYDAASAIMGRLEKYAETDYRVAWAMLTLYRALGDQRAAAAALERANALRGDRDIAVEPVL